MATITNKANLSKPTMIYPNRDLITSILSRKRKLAPSSIAEFKPTLRNQENTKPATLTSNNQSSTKFIATTENSKHPRPSLKSRTTTYQENMVNCECICHTRCPRCTRTTEHDDRTRGCRCATKCHCECSLFMPGKIQSEGLGILKARLDYYNDAEDAERGEDMMIWDDDARIFDLEVDERGWKEDEDANVFEWEEEEMSLEECIRVGGRREVL